MERQKRIYENDWPGKEVFFCGGRLIAGPGWPNLFVTVLLIVAPLAVFLVFPARYLGQEISWAFFAVGSALGLFSLLWLLITGCTDPGIMPRQAPDEQYLRGDTTRTMDLEVNGHSVTVRYDDTCHFYRPPRCHHCSVNDNCIQKFDHHCPWIGTTIGLRNYRFFLLFIFNSTLLCLFVFGSCVYQIHLKKLEKEKDVDYSIGKVFESTIPALILIVYTFLQIWLVGGLTVFHAYLVSTNQTTYEKFKRGQTGNLNPYSKGFFVNCWEALFSKIPPPKIKYRQLVEVTQPEEYEMVEQSNVQNTESSLYYQDSQNVSQGRQIENGQNQGQNSNGQIQSGGCENENNGRTESVEVRTEVIEQ